MKCNIPKVKEVDRQRLIDALAQVRCCKCGRVVEVMSMPYVFLHFDKKRYENRLCKYCKEEADNEQSDKNNL